MIEALTEKFSGVFRSLSGRGRISEENIRESMREVRTALLEADVNHKVVKDFTDAVVTKALGPTEDVLPASYATDLQDGDMIVLCSDGVWAIIGEAAMRDILVGGRDPAQTCRTLIEAADHAGGHDNETVVAVLVR